MQNSVKLFFSYSHKDEDFRNELESHLALLKREGVISAWYDRRVTAGSDLTDQIDSNLESSQIILLLVSAHFLDSDYCFEKEMKRAIEMHREGTAVVIPIILHPCDWHSAPFGSLRATPTDGKPISMYANQQEAFAIVAKDVRIAIESSLVLKPKSEHAIPSERITRSRLERSSNLRIKKKYDDQERDQFLEDSYEYIARYFDGSLQELSVRNPQLKTKFKRLDETSFVAIIYQNGSKIAECSIYYGAVFGGSSAIAYSYSSTVNRNSFNESLSVIDDGYTLQLHPLGLAFTFRSVSENYSQQGAAEYYWSLFIKPLQ